VLASGTRDPQKMNMIVSRQIRSDLSDSFARAISYRTSWMGCFHIASLYGMAHFANIWIHRSMGWSGQLSEYGRLAGSIVITRTLFL